MALVLPFRGLRYNTKTALDLAMVTAPPYDCISPRQQQDLYDSHPYNVVRLILGKQEKGDNGGNNRYARAAATLKEWIDAGVLLRERHPALYLYEQEFTANGQTTIRRGFVAQVALEELGQGTIYPHEKTFDKPKADRLSLLKATRCNLSQVLALYPDEGNEVMSVFDRLALSSPDLQAVEDTGVVNRMWIVTDESAAAEVNELMHRRPLFIADGHHRYQTALTYRQYLRDRGENVSEHHPANFTTMSLVSMSDPGLVILPTHRVLTDVPQTSAEELHGLLKDHFSWEQQSGAEATSGRMVEHIARSGKVAFGVYVRGDQAGYVARLTDDRLMAELSPDHSDEWRRLDVAVLHRMVLGRLLADIVGDADDLKIRYVAKAGEAFDAVHEDGASLAFLLRPTRIEQLKAIASAGEMMPQKSTFFYPKLLSGLVMNPLD